MPCCQVKWRLVQKCSNLCKVHWRPLFLNNVMLLGKGNEQISAILKILYTYQKFPNFSGKKCFSSPGWKKRFSTLMLVKLNKLIRVLTKNTSLSVFVKQFCFSIFYGFFYTQLAFSSYFLCFLLWWSWETLSRNLMLEQLLVFFECSSIQFLIHSLLVRPPFVTYHSLCCARVTYAMSCHTI